MKERKEEREREREREREKEMISWVNEEDNKNK